MKTLLEKWQRYLTESGLGRLYKHIQEHDSAILSAFRGEYTKGDNMDRSAELKAKLLSQGFGVTKVDGSYIENFSSPQAVEVKELSFFVSNKDDKDSFEEFVLAQGQEYDQDSVLIIPMGGQDAYLVGTREGNDFPPRGKKITVGNLKMGGESEFMSRVKNRPFTFNELETYEGLSRNSKWAVKKLVEQANKRKKN